jgi:hypothetical protein
MNGNNCMNGLWPFSADKPDNRSLNITKNFAALKNMIGQENDVLTLTRS